MLTHLRWYICGLLFFVTFINYVDRVSLAGMNEHVLKPAIGWDDAEYAWVQFSFSLSYAVMFAFAGRLLDRIGVRAVLTDPQLRLVTRVDTREGLVRQRPRTTHRASLQ